ncbi:hypothetical protein ACFSKW_16250 [Nonomuraea mangrovi]|uniref:Gram-positive cocci surface proteins LPxTG domain-containing protein n=1 Tax=Nonomuraea mangrovi TaxID=2316207 RepID=A0ABW4SWP3_9ACTN
MLKSVARRRLALKTSALGLAGTLALFVGSIAGLASPAEASTAARAADKTMTIPFNCTGGPFAGTDTVQAKITMPDNVATGASVPIKWEFVTMRASQVITAQSKLVIDADLDVTGSTTAEGGTSTELTWDQDVTLSAQVPVGSSPTLQPKTVNAKPDTGATSVVAKPVPTQTSLWLSVTPSGQTTESESVCVAGTATPASLTTTVGGTGGGTGDSTVAYKCATTTNSDPKDTSLLVTMTMPTAAKANEEQSIPWSATYASGATQLTVPASGFTSGTKLIVGVSVSGGGVSGTSVTGESAPLTTLTAGTAITTFPTVTLKVKPTTASPVTMKAADLYFGTSSSTFQYKCTAQTTPTPKSYTFQVGAGTGTTPTPTPTPTPSATPKPTRTVTATVTQTPVGAGNGKVTKTPKGAAETGGGGELGPDGRMFVVTGSLIVLAAAVGGLVLRRRTTSRG